MSNGDREADGEGSRSQTTVSSLICHSKNADNKLHSEENLHSGCHPQADPGLQLKTQKWHVKLFIFQYWILWSVKIPRSATYCVHGHVASHVARCDSVQHRSPSDSAQALGNDVEEGAEKRHLWTDKVGEGDCRVDVAAADVADGLDEGGGCQTEAQSHMKDVMGPGSPAKGSTHAKKYKEHGPKKLSEDCPPKIHRPELPHGDCTLGGFVPNEDDSLKMNVGVSVFKKATKITHKKGSPFGS